MKAVWQEGSPAWLTMRLNLEAAACEVSAKALHSL